MCFDKIHFISLLLLSLAGSVRMEFVWMKMKSLDGRGTEPRSVQYSRTSVAKIAG